MTAPVPKWPSDLVRKRNNQRLLAKRTGWPDGALQACWGLMDRHPGWHVSWMDENTTPGFEHPAGYWATNDSVPQHAAEAFRTDARELEETIAGQPPPHDYGSRSWLRPCAWCQMHPPPAIAARRVRL